MVHLLCPHWACDYALPPSATFITGVPHSLLHACSRVVYANLDWARSNLVALPACTVCG